ncbi:alpha/beta fold hydrolase [Sphingomonas sp. 28-63-12]|uniref:alpha/beta fold hydrolase n=1 Tax=Sphingomonas sp. 28-63-12 TaxID=1970434 RepID=UPI000BC76372|nr:MAG: hypothetical protein B7Y47_09625 [Sphingomonas sp. 28-63-12]
MASFILVHGSWHGGWCFDALRPLLEAQGHEMIAPDLPGMEPGAHDIAAITLNGWATTVADWCRQATQSPVILCGHSRGGLVISQAAELAPDTIDALVYICAMLMPPGMARSAFKRLQQANPAFDAIIHSLPGGGGTVIDPTNAAAVFCHQAPPAIAAAAMARLVPEPAGPRATPLVLTAARYGRVPRHYIECSEDRTIPIADQRAMQAMQPCASVATLPADHSPFLTMPDALAARLIAIADNHAAEQR